MRLHQKYAVLWPRVCVVWRCIPCAGSSAPSASQRTRASPPSTCCSACRRVAETRVCVRGLQVSLSASQIYDSCKVRNKDIRKFLDGVYISERTNVVVDED